MVDLIRTSLHISTASCVCRFDSMKFVVTFILPINSCNIHHKHCTSHLQRSQNNEFITAYVIYSIHVDIVGYCSFSIVSTFTFIWFIVEKIPSCVHTTCTNICYKIQYQKSTPKQQNKSLYKLAEYCEAKKKTVISSQQLFLLCIHCRAERTGTKLSLTRHTGLKKSQTFLSRLTHGDRTVDITNKPL